MYVVACCAGLLCWVRCSIGSCTILVLTCRCTPAVEVGELLRMTQEELAVKCLPAALAALATNDDLAMQALVDKAGMHLPEAWRTHGYQAVAKSAFEGKESSSAT